MKIWSRIFAGILAAGMALAMCGCSGEMSSKDLAKGITVVEGESSKGNTGELTLADGDLVAVFDIKGYGTIKAKLFPEVAPVGVDNFVKLCDSGYYEGLSVHRVVSDFMMQGGSLNGDGTGGEALVEDGSFGIETDLDAARHFYGALCYANAMGRNSTQFYIVNNNKPQTLSDTNVNGVLAYAEQYSQAAQEATDSDEAAYYAFWADYYDTMAEAVTAASDEAAAKYAEVGGTPSLDGNYTVFGQVYDGFDVIEKIAAAEVTDNGSGEQSKPVKDITIKSVKVYEYTAD